MKDDGVSGCHRSPPLFQLPSHLFKPNPSPATLGELEELAKSNPLLVRNLKQDMCVRNSGPVVFP